MLWFPAICLDSGDICGSWTLPSLCASLSSSCHSAFLLQPSSYLPQGLCMCSLLCGIVFFHVAAWLAPSVHLAPAHLSPPWRPFWSTHVRWHHCCHQFHICVPPGTWQHPKGHMLVSLVISSAKEEAPCAGGTLHSSPTVPRTVPIPVILDPFW